MPRPRLQNGGLSASRSYLESGNTTLTFTFSSQGLGIVDSPLSPLSKVGQGKFRVPPSSLEIGEENVWFFSLLIQSFGLSSRSGVAGVLQIL